MPTQLTHRQRHAIAHFASERDALFDLLEFDRQAPLAAPIAHRVLAATGHATRAHLPDIASPQPADLFIALTQTSLALAALLAAHRVPRPKGDYPRAEASE